MNGSSLKGLMAGILRVPDLGESPGWGPVLRSNSTKDLLDGEGKLQVQVPCKICIGCLLPTNSDWRYRLTI